MDLEAKKTCLKNVENGLYLIGCTDGKELNVFLGSWLSQCSFEPPLVMVGVKRDTQHHTFIKDSGGFVVNMPALDQKDMVKSFFKHQNAVDGTIGGEAYTLSPVFKAPILERTPYWFECKVRAWVEGGDHDVVIGEVVEAGTQEYPSYARLTESATGWNYGG